MSLLEIRNLSVDFATSSGQFRAVDGVDVSVNGGEILAIVGESGSGKSVSMLAAMGLLPWTATVTADVLKFDGHDLRSLSPRDRRQIVVAGIGFDISPEWFRRVRHIFAWQIASPFQQRRSKAEIETEQGWLDCGLFDQPIQYFLSRPDMAGPDQARCFNAPRRGDGDTFVAVALRARPVDRNEASKAVHISGG